MTEREKMEQGLLYDSGNAEIMREQTECVGFLKIYNNMSLGDEAHMVQLMPLMFAEVGDYCYIQPPFYANWGGAHVHLGSYIYANYNLTLVDDGHIYIGDHTMIGPNVTIATAAHPITPSLREKGLQYNLDVHIGENVWIGAGVTIVPGVHIGADSVIGAGAVVTKDIPAGVVAVGNPCRVLREIGEQDEIADRSRL